MAGFSAGWLLAVLLQAQSASPAAAAPAAPVRAAPTPPDCKAAPYSDLAFWVGDWIVSDTASSTPLAESRIQAEADGCTIRESYSQIIGPGGKPMHYLGTSLSAYDARSGHWRQFYVDTMGNVTQFEGEGVPGRIVLVSRRGTGSGRMTIELQADGSVRQRGESRTSDAADWTPGYDFTYRRK